MPPPTYRASPRRRILVVDDNVVERLKKDVRPASVRFIAVTGSDGEEARKRSRESGFDEHLVKPVDLDTLRKLLGRL
jgi:CheY-like chemotaxis protein